MYEPDTGAGERPAAAHRCCDMADEGPALAGPSTTPVPVTLGDREKQPMIRDQRGWPEAIGSS
eukprot:2094707-Prymnesium_polylepis.1